VKVAAGHVWNVWPDPEESVTLADAALGAAWRRCEAALPEGWELHIWCSPTGSLWRTAAAHPPMGTYQRKIAIGGPDMAPAAALEALATKLESLR
jgi:hypothetical protein